MNKIIKQMVGEYNKLQQYIIDNNMQINTLEYAIDNDYKKYDHGQTLYTMDLYIEYKFIILMADYYDMTFKQMEQKMCIGTNPLGIILDKQWQDKFKSII